MFRYSVKKDKYFYLTLFSNQKRFQKLRQELLFRVYSICKAKISNKFLISDKVSDLAKYKKIVPIITLNKTSKESLNKFKSKVDNLKLEILNLIIISNYNE